MTPEKEIIASISRIRNHIDTIRNYPKKDRREHVEIHLARFKQVIDEEYENIKRILNNGISKETQRS